MINIEKVLKSHDIQYVTTGHNVAKGNLNVKCPMCGSDDKSEHMGINKINGVWGCWRNEAHRGSNLAFLLQRLLRIGYKEAERLTEQENRTIDQDALDQLAQGSLYSDDNVTMQRSGLRNVLLPKEFRKFPDDGLAARKFLRYLNSRGFLYSDFGEYVTEYYRMRYVIKGIYKGRLVLPVYLNGVLVTYTTRDIGNSDYRYLAQPDDEATINIKETVYNFDEALAGGYKLFIVEGPFDALKLDWYGRKFSCHAVALFNMNLEEAQFYLLNDLVSKYNEVHVVMDRGMEPEGKRIYDQLEPFVNGGSYYSIQTVKDPGELARVQVESLCE